MDEATYHDPRRICPCCEERGGLRYVVIPENRRLHVSTEGAECTHYFGPSKDYTCRNCESEFTLTEDTCHG